MLNQYFRTAFADAGDKAAIPEPTQAGGEVSYNQGFGPDYELPYSNASSKDIPRDQSNQLYFAITKALQEYQQNGVPDWIDPSQNGAVNFPYPLHARVRYSNGVIYESIVAANNSLPTDTTKWVPVGQGIAAIAGLTNANVALTEEQASHPIITLAGVLTGNINITVPPTQRQWLVQNNTTGAFAITFKTTAGAGVIVKQGESAAVWSNGTDVLSALAPGRLIGVRVITTTQVYTPTAGTRSVDVIVVGGGGGGGGGAATGAGQCSAGAGGGGGGWARKRITSGFSGVTATIGAPGAGGVIAAGGNGGTTSFGALVSASGGGGGALGLAATNATVSLNGSGGQGAGASGDVNFIGGIGSYAIYTLNPISGRGGSSFGGDGAPWVVGGFVSGAGAAAIGGGGSGGASQASQGGTTGGAGAQGVCIVYEYD